MLAFRLQIYSALCWYMLADGDRGPTVNYMKVAVLLNADDARALVSRGAGLVRIVRAL